MGSTLVALLRTKASMLIPRIIICKLINFNIRKEHVETYTKWVGMKTLHIPSTDFCLVICCHSHCHLSSITPSMPQAEFTCCGDFCFNTCLVMLKMCAAGHLWVVLISCTSLVMHWGEGVHIFLWEWVSWCAFGQLNPWWYCHIPPAWFFMYKVGSYHVANVGYVATECAKSWRQ